MPSGTRSRNPSEKGPDACGHGHGQCAPERYAQRAFRHACSACARRQPTQEREEQQGHSSDEGDQTRRWYYNCGQKRHGGSNGNRTKLWKGELQSRRKDGSAYTYVRIEYAPLP